MAGAWAALSRRFARREEPRARVVVRKALEGLEAAEHLAAAPAAHPSLLRVELDGRDAEAREAVRAGGDQHRSGTTLARQEHPAGIARVHAQGGPR